MTSRRSGNYVTEWFGFRVWPNPEASHAAREHQSGSLCPFLSAALRMPSPCTKTNSGQASGVCTISSDSNGPREDWLACPYRTLDTRFSLLTEAISTTYKIKTADIKLIPMTMLREPTFRRELDRSLRERRRVFVFSSDKMGGEVDLPETPASPGLKIDFSVIEITAPAALEGDASGFGKHLFFELQTADFHGSPLHAVRRLRQAVEGATSKSFHSKIAADPNMAGERVEGPNKANIFKRTLYQLVLKILIAEHDESAGIVFALPSPVWTSWLRHLGQPEIRLENGVEALELRALPRPRAEAWIFVFDVDSASTQSPQPLKIVRRVRTTAEALLEFAFRRAAEGALDAKVVETFRKILQGRIKVAAKTD